MPTELIAPKPGVYEVADSRTTGKLSSNNSSSHSLGRREVGKDETRSGPTAARELLQRLGKRTTKVTIPTARTISVITSALALSIRRSCHRSLSRCRVMVDPWFAVATLYGSDVPKKLFTKFVSSTLI
jgi:hypothetical protein